MKILRISLLLNLFSNTKNQSKFLTYINIGLFLSIFAISAAVITFYIETKIDKIEFELIENHIEQRSNQKIYYWFKYITVSIFSNSIIVGKALSRSL